MDGSGLDRTNSDLVAAFWYQHTGNWKISYQARFDHSSLAIREQDVGLSGTLYRLKTDLNYVKVDEAVAYGRPTSLEQIWGSAVFDIGSGISLVGGGRYDIEADQIVNRYAGIRFDCDCAKVSLLYKEAFDTDVVNDRERSFVLNVELITLGSTSFGSSLSQE